MNEKRAVCLARLRNTPHTIEPGQEFVVDDFRPEDSQGVARLYYEVYGDSFPVDYVYDPKEIARLNAGIDLHQVVSRTQSGDVVGLYALFRNPPGRHIMEAGSWIVHPAYRNTTMAMRMARKIHLHPPERLGLNAIFGQSVCNHLLTQRMSKLFGALECALEIEAMPPKPDSLGGLAEGRVSLLDGELVFHGQFHEVYLPEQYAEALRAMYASIGLEREFALDSTPEPESKTVFSMLAIGEAGPVKMTVEEPGRDFARCLAAMESEHPERHVYQILLPLARRGCCLAVQEARKAGFFLGGILPLWFDRDGLLLQKVAGEPDISRIRLLTLESRNLLEIVMADRESLP